MSAEEKLCIKVLRILQEMLIRTLDFDEKVSSNSAASLRPPAEIQFFLIRLERLWNQIKTVKYTPQNPDLFVCFDSKRTRQGAANKVFYRTSVMLLLVNSCDTLNFITV